MSYLSNAAQFLIDLAFSLLIGLFVIRVLLQMVRANFYNPICQFFYKATNPVLIPLRRILPTLRGFDTAAAVVAFLLQCLALLVLALFGAPLPGVLGVFVLAVALLILLLVKIYFVLFLLMMVVSFVARDSRHPLIPVVYQLTEPVLRPLRKVLPSIGGIDFSPMLAGVIGVLVIMLVVAPLGDLGMRL